MNHPPPNPDDAVRNSDSYAWFAMDVSAEYQAPAQRAPTPPAAAPGTEAAPAQPGGSR